MERKFNFLEIDVDPSKLVKARGLRGKREVAETIGVTVQAIDNIESGRSRPSASVLIKLCALYNVDARSLATQKILAA